MGTSFVTTDGTHGFWMRDSILELWLRLLALHVREPSNEDSAAIHDASKQIRNQWLLASKGYFLGWVPHGLDDAVLMPEGAVVVRSAVESLLRVLEKAPEALNKDVLNLLGFEGGNFDSDVESWRLIEVAHAFIDLLDGKFVGTPISTAFMPGCR